MSAAYLGGMRVLVAAFVAASVMIQPGGPAHAQDPRANHRSCVSSREFNSLRANTYRSVVERRWEVVGQGVRFNELVVGPMIAYRWCGHGDMSHAYVAVQYRNGGKSGWSEQYDCRWVGNSC